MIQALWTTDTASQVFKDSIAIRHEVFIEEQKYPPGSDIDKLEEKTEHLVLYDNEKAIATARIYNLGENTYRIERVAVQNDERNRGLGRKIMTEVEAKIEALGGEKITLKSEDIAIDFYKKFGYQTIGDEIIEYGFSHQEMVKDIKGEINNEH